MGWKSFFKPLLFYIILILLPSLVVGQQKRPKIGLVLSGGGAKGIAHIGVLKAMEEAGLTPDYITGTSMGSIIGALYAAGYSADELREIVLSADWDLLLSNKTPFDKVAFEEKDYYGRYLIDFYMHDGKLLLPKGIIEGQALTELFSEITRPVHHISDFSQLPIPFACVATNIVTGKPAVLKHGSLANAMRASMAIPSIFTPVKIDDQLLVDGGLVRNMPVDEALDMGADIIIGVFVSTDLDPEEKLTSAFSILSQSAFIASAFDTREQLKKCDLLIEPNLKDFSTGSFKEAADILVQGDQAGEKYKDRFKKLADSLRAIEPLHQINKPLQVESYSFSAINVIGNKAIPEEYILGKMRIKANEPISVTKLTNKLTLVYGTQYFEKMWYEILGDSTNSTLNIHVIERPKVQFRFSYHYDTENKGGIVANMTLRNFLLPGSRMILEADLATNPKVLLDYFKYIGKRQDLAFGTRGIYISEELPLYNPDGNKEGTFTNTYYSYAAKLQTTIFRNSAYGIEAYFEEGILKPKVISEDFRFINKMRFGSTSLDAFYLYNSYDSRYFPKKGIEANAIGTLSLFDYSEYTVFDTLVYSSNELFGEADLNNNYNIELLFAPIIPVSPKLSILTRFKTRYSSNKNTYNLIEYDYIGGFVPSLVNSMEYMGVGPKEYQLSSYIFGRIGLQFEILNNLFLQGHLSYIDSEYPSRWLNPSRTPDKLINYYRRYSYALTLGYNSIIGPIQLGIAKDNYRKDYHASLIIGFFY